MIALIDGDIYAYKASSSVQKDIYWGDGLWTCHSYEEDAIEVFETIVEEIQYSLANHGVQCSSLLFAFSDPDENFRKTIDPNYKANRIGNRKPVCYNGLVDWIKNNYEAISYKGLEADDCLGLSTNNDTVIVSDDKDFKTVPGRFLRFSEDELYIIDKETADKNLLIQALMGDKVDGYSGCPTMGPVKAARLINGTKKEDLWKTYVQQFLNQGLTEQDAYHSVCLARILRPGEYDHSNKTPILMDPADLLRN